MTFFPLIQAGIADIVTLVVRTEDPVPSEAYIRGKVEQHAKKTGWVVLILDYGGWPDRLFVSPTGVHVYIEFKSSTGKLAKRQEHNCGILKHHGCHVYKVNDIDLGKSILDLHASLGGVDPS